MFTKLAECEVKNFLPIRNELIQKHDKFYLSVSNSQSVVLSNRKES